MLQNWTMIKPEEHLNFVDPLSEDNLMIVSFIVCERNCSFCWSRALWSGNMIALIQAELHRYIKTCQRIKNGSFAKSLTSRSWPALTLNASFPLTMQVHAYIISSLKKEMPSVFGKENKKKELIASLGDIYKRIEREHQISPGDFPNLKKMQVNGKEQRNVDSLIEMVEIDKT